MKKLIGFLVLFILIITVNANAEFLRWTIPAGDIDGYTAIYSAEGEPDRIKSFDGTWTEVPNMENFFTLEYNKTYTFRLQAYNISGASPLSLPSNTYTRTGYVPPADTEPVVMPVPPEQIQNPLIDL
jgi:hypothetical protein